MFFCINLHQVQHENQYLHDSLKSSKLAGCELETLLQEKNQEVSRLNDDVISLQSKMQCLEEVYRKEIDTQKERVNENFLTC